MLMKKYFPGLCKGMLIVLISGNLTAKADCGLSVEGKVFDTKPNKVLSFASVSIFNTEKGVITDQEGNFIISGLCTGTYTFSCSFVGYETVEYKVFIDKSTRHNFILRPQAITMNEVVVRGTKAGTQVLLSQVKTDVAGSELMKARGESLGESLKSVTGVSTFQSGPSIFKPVIHGLHSNRILILNNGVRQEGQQWGSEHAPEIDPFIATRLSVLKGASSLRYGSDAIGGVILVEPASMPETPGISGEVNLVGASNNRLGVASGYLQDAFDKKLTGLSWRGQGTFRTEQGMQEHLATIWKIPASRKSITRRHWFIKRRIMVQKFITASLIPNWAYSPELRRKYFRFPGCHRTAKAHYSLLLQLCYQPALSDSTARFTKSGCLF